MDDLPETVENLLRPIRLTSLIDKTPYINVKIFTSPDDEGELLQINGTAPFYTIDDIKRLIFIEKGKDEAFLPKFLFLGIPQEDPSEDSGQNDKYLHADLLWYALDSTDIPLLLVNPYNLINSESNDSRFVESNGNKKAVGSNPRGLMTIEDVFSEYESMPTLHVFTFKDCLAAFSGNVPISEADWIGRFSPYFFSLQKDNYSITAEDKKYGGWINVYMTRRQQHLQILEEIVNEGLPLSDLNVISSRFIRLTWTTEEYVDIEKMFFEKTVTTNRPFMRFFPQNDVPISKLKTKGVLNIPDLPDPAIVLNWAKDTSHDPERSSLQMKLIVRKAFGSLSPLYGTFRISEGGDADFFLLPPKGQKFLDINYDLKNIDASLSASLKDLPYRSIPFNIGEANLILRLQILEDSVKITKPVLQKRLSCFRSFFQVIPGLPGDKAIINLRYKCVSNYSNEDNISIFLTQLVGKKIVEGENLNDELVSSVAEEFQLSTEEAMAFAAKWLKNKNAFSVAQPESKHYILKKNPGTDIGVYYTKGSYNFDIQRITSREQLQVIVTLLSILFSASDDSLEGCSTGEKQIKQAEQIFIQDTPQLDAEIERSEHGDEEELEDDDINLLLASFGNEETADFKTVAVAEKVAETSVEPATAPAPAPAKKEIAAAATEDFTPVESVANFYINQLNKVDRRLFQYKNEKTRIYSAQCQSAPDQQPAVFNKDQFEHFNSVYKDDIESGEISVVIYPLQKGQPDPPLEGEIYSFMEYGSNPMAPNYYFCSQFFCIRDYMILRQSEYEGTVDRKGRKKAKNSCPFCGGLEIITRRKKMITDDDANRTVFQRKKKPGSTKRHTHIGFLKNSFHPEGFGLPCCYIRAKVLRIKDKKFDTYNKYLQELREQQRDPEDPIVEEEESQNAVVHAVNYVFALENSHNQYIIDEAKYPLLITDNKPQIGLLSKSLDEYFSQKSGSLLERSGYKNILKGDAKGFLRLAVENRAQFQSQSFFSCLAPLMFKTSPDEVRDVFDKYITPAIFIAANFGNLVLEFFDPTDEEPAQNLLIEFAIKDLKAETYNNTAEISRIYRSYYRFKSYLNDNNRPKEYRHFAHILAQPGYIERIRGLVLVVLEYMDDGQVRVKCPPYGFPDRPSYGVDGEDATEEGNIAAAAAEAEAEKFYNADIAFVTFNKSGIWEPLFYTDNRKAHGGYEAQHNFRLLFERAAEAIWPPVVSQRVSEYVNNCKSRFLGAYTASSDIQPDALMSISEIINSLAQTPVGIVRDIWNHMVGVTFIAVPGKNRLFMIPCSDDGAYIRADLKLHLGWTDYKSLSFPKEIMKFFETNMSGLLEKYPGYRIVGIAKFNNDDSYCALKLENGLLIPCKYDPTNFSKLDLPVLPEIDEVEININKKIYTFNKEKEVPAKLQQIQVNQLEEIYQHLRITFANWLVTIKNAGDMRDKLQRIFNNTSLPLSDKRTQILVEIGGEVSSWLDMNDYEGLHEDSYIRKDCWTTSEDKCDGHCRWSSEKDKCLLHVGSEATLGSKVKVRTADYLISRLIDEIIRFPYLRSQLFTNKVKRLSFRGEAEEKVGQLFLPENSVAWYNLLRTDWIEKRGELEKARYIEEMGVEAAKGEEREVLANAEVTAPADADSTVLPAPPKVSSSLKISKKALKPKTVVAKAVEESPVTLKLSKKSLKPKTVAVEKAVEAPVSVSAVSAPLKFSKTLKKSNVKTTAAALPPLPPLPKFSKTLKKKNKLSTVQEENTPMASVSEAVVPSAVPPAVSQAVAPAVSQAVAPAVSQASPEVPPVSQATPAVPQAVPEVPQVVPVVSPLFKTASEAPSVSQAASEAPSLSQAASEAPSVSQAASEAPSDSQKSSQLSSASSQNTSQKSQASNDNPFAGYEEE